MIQIAIVEDEQTCADQLQDYLLKFQEEEKEPLDITTYKNGIIFLNDAAAAGFDIVFMDIEMPHLDGLKTAGRFREVNPCAVLIFITNLAQYAIHGYEVNAMDYMLKPVNYSALAVRLKRAIRIAGQRERRKVVLKVKSGFMQMEIADIYYIEVIKHRLVYHTASGTVEVWDSLARVEKELAESGFSRCNSCYLVNMRYVTGLQEDFVQVQKEQLKISRSRKKEFMSALMSYMQGMKPV